MQSSQCEWIGGPPLCVFVCDVCVCVCVCACMGVYMYVTRACACIAAFTLNAILEWAQSPVCEQPKLHLSVCKTPYPIKPFLSVSSANCASQLLCAGLLCLS